MGVVISDSMALGTPNAGKIIPRKDQDPSGPNVLDPKDQAEPSVPRIINAKQQALPSGPNVLSPEPDENTLPEPLTHARIGYENLFESGSSSPSAANAALTPDTWERWRPSSGSTATFTATSNQSNVDYVAIGAGRWSGITVTIQTSSSLSASFITRAEIQATDNRPIMVLFDPATVRRVRVIFSGAAELGVMYAGRVLAMQRPIFGGHQPEIFAARTEYRANKSQAGQWLGRDIVRQGSATSFDWSNLTDDWVRDNLIPFIESAKTTPFFIAWRPEDYPDEVAYCWTTSDPDASNQGGGNKLMSFNLQVEGHSDK